MQKLSFPVTLGDGTAISTVYIGAKWDSNPKPIPKEHTSGTQHKVLYSKYEQHAKKVFTIFHYVIALRSYVPQVVS